MKPGQRGRQRGTEGFSALERFANAKTSTYDKQRRKEREFALNAKKVNKYRKLKQRLANAGRLQPNIPATEESEEDQADHDQPSKRRKGSLDMKRLLARAGPAPEGDGEDGGTDEDMVGSLSGEDEREAHTTPGATHLLKAGQSPATPVPEKHVHTQGDSADTARDSHGQGRDSGREGGAAGGTAWGGPHAPPSKRKQKPLSQLQRIAAKVKEQKDAVAEAREKKRRELEERREKVAAAEKERKKVSKLLRKRTRHGQPVMKVRMDKILGQLQAEMG